MSTTATKAQHARDRARRNRLAAARERRRRLDPEQLAREQRIDEAVVDVELAWERRVAAEQAIHTEELAAGRAIERLLAERLTLADISRLTGLDHSLLRRLKSAIAATASRDQSVQPSVAPSPVRSSSE